MSLFHIIKTYELEAIDEKEAVEKLTFMEKEQKQWLMLKHTSIKEIPWPKPPEDIEF